MNSFVLISIIPFFVFTIPSNSLSVLPCPYSWRLVVLEFNCRNSQFLAIGIRAWLSSALVEIRSSTAASQEALASLRTRSDHYAKKFKKYKQFKKCTHELWMRWINNWQFWYKAVVVLIKEDCLHLQQMVKSDILILHL